MADQSAADLTARRAQCQEWRDAGFVVDWDPADHPLPDETPAGPFGMMPRWMWDASGRWAGLLSRLLLVLTIIAWSAALFAAQTGVLTTIASRLEN